MMNHTVTHHAFAQHTVSAGFAPAVDGIAGSIIAIGAVGGGTTTTSGTTTTALVRPTLL